MGKVATVSRIILVCLAIAGCSASAVVTALGDQSLVVDEPEWNVGDEWVFRVTHGLSEEQLTVRVAVAGPGGYLLRGLEWRTEYYWLPGFQFFGMVRDGEIVQQYLPPLPMFNFPLKAGFTWRQGEGEAASSGPT